MRHHEDTKMITQQEHTLIKKFVIKNKQDRYLTFLEKDKTRKKFINELYHFKDFNWKLFREISGNEPNGKQLLQELIPRKIFRVVL
jgi:hypothetical protein